MLKVPQQDSEEPQDLHINERFHSSPTNGKPTVKYLPHHCLLNDSNDSEISFHPEECNSSGIYFSPLKVNSTRGKKRYFQYSSDDDLEASTGFNDSVDETFPRSPYNLRSSSRSLSPQPGPSDVILPVDQENLTEKERRHSIGYEMSDVGMKYAPLSPISESLEEHLDDNTLVAKDGVEEMSKPCINIILHLPKHFHTMKIPLNVNVSQESFENISTHHETDLANATINSSRSSSSLQETRLVRTVSYESFLKNQSYQIVTGEIPEPQKSSEDKQSINDRHEHDIPNNETIRSENNAEMVGSNDTTLPVNMKEENYAAKPGTSGVNNNSDDTIKEKKITRGKKTNQTGNLQQERKNNTKTGNGKAPSKTAKKKPENAQKQGPRRPRLRRARTAEPQRKNPGKAPRNNNGRKNKKEFRESSCNTEERSEAKISCATQTNNLNQCKKGARASRNHSSSSTGSDSSYDCAVCHGKFCDNFSFSDSSFNSSYSESDCSCSSSDHF